MSSKKIAAVKYQCDRCKTTLISEIDAEAMNKTFSGWIVISVSDEERDICKRCAESFLEWITEFEPRKGSEE